MTTELGSDEDAVDAGVMIVPRAAIFPVFFPERPSRYRCVIVVGIIERSKSGFLYVQSSS